MEKSDGDYPEFDDAVTRLRNFLRNQNLSSDIWWIALDDCALKDKQLFVRPRAHAVAEAEARIEYQEATKRRLGVGLTMLFEADKRACCHVFAPTSDLESEYALMPNGLKLGALDPVRKAKVVESSNLKKWEKLCARPERRWIRDMFG